MKDKATKRVEAAARQAAYDSLSLDEKIAKAYKRGGDSREYKRLVARRETSA